jgi:hypothetical protein
MDSDEKAGSSTTTTTTTLKQCVQTLTLDEINPHDLYPNQNTPMTTQPIDILYDTGASITMLPLDYPQHGLDYDHAYTKLLGVSQQKELTLIYK